MPFKFDNQYYKNLILHKGLLSSDEVLFTQNKDTMEIVEKFANDQGLFFENYVKSIVKMGNISPLTGNNGEIRKICRRVNHN
jgi:peroxidase